MCRTISSVSLIIYARCHEFCNILVSITIIEFLASSENFIASIEQGRMRLLNVNPMCRSTFHKLALSWKRPLGSV